MDEYLGFKEVTLSDEELALIYQKTPNYNLGCLQNEYLVVHNKTGETVDHFRWDGSQFVQVPFKQINSRFGGKVKPRNTQQRLAIDMLYNPEITINMLGGKFGTGKTFIMAATAMDLLEKGKFDQGRIEIVHFGQIRGRDLKNSIIMCSEVENMTKEHVQLLIGRVGEGSVLWLDGDVKQVDMEVFRLNSGMQIALERLKGHHRFGYVKFLKTERSETAAMADLLD